MARPIILKEIDSQIKTYDQLDANLDSRIEHYRHLLKRWIIQTDSISLTSIWTSWEKYDTRILTVNFEIFKSEFFSASKRHRECAGILFIQSNRQYNRFILYVRWYAGKEVKRGNNTASLIRISETITHEQQSRVIVNYYTNLASIRYTYFFR